MKYVSDEQQRKQKATTRRGAVMKEELEQLAPDGFVMIRNGIREHIEGGRLAGYALGVYFYLHLTCTWKTGICYTNAVPEKR
jgi:hypothetical protein